MLLRRVPAWRELCLKLAKACGVNRGWRLNKMAPLRPQRICIVGGGISALGAAWALSQHPERFEFVLYEKNGCLGGNAMTVDIPQDNGSTIPIDISVTACIPTVYHNFVELMKHYNIELIPTRFSYSVTHEDDIYAHDFDSNLKRSLQPEIDRFQRLIRRLQRFNVLNTSRSRLLAFLNPFNYIRIGTLLNLGRFSGEFRYKVLKPMFVNFLMATNVFDMPAALFSRYLDFFNIETATPMMTWDQGTRNIYDHLVSSFQDRIYLNRAVKRIRRSAEGVEVIDADGKHEQFDQIILACNANQALMLLEQPTRMELAALSAVRYESELHNHAVVHSDASVLPDNETKPLEMRSNYIEQYGSRPDNYEITYIMHNQQPWAQESDKPCLVTYNPHRKIDASKIIHTWWFQHVVHDVFQSTFLVGLFPWLQGRRRTWYCGAHTLINSQETCFVSGLAVARQLGADYPFHNEEARKWFNFYGRVLHGRRFRRVNRDEKH